jgi:hypothetical protein
MDQQARECRREAWRAVSQSSTRFNGYSYRTSSRFGGRVQLSVDHTTVSVTGPRVGVLTYRLWIALMVVLLWLTPASLLAAAIVSDWRYLILALVLFLAHWGVSGVGAGSLWGIADLAAFMAGEEGETTSFASGTVKRVRLGRAWGRKLWFVIPHFIAMNTVPAGQVVSWEAPDGATGTDAVYAIVFPSEEDGTALQALLEGQEALT